MGKKLAIKGHPTRGKEVIELLEMMGGKNKWLYDGSDGVVYFIEKNDKYITYCGKECIKNTGEYIIYELEEFLEKYPYKVGDKIPDVWGNSCTVKSMSWDENYKTVMYGFEETIFVVRGDELYMTNIINNHTEPYKMKNVLAELLEHIKTTPKEELEREFEEIKEWTNVGPSVEEFRTFCECVNKKSKYPKTYVECCEVLDYCGDYFLTTYDNNGNPSIISNILNSINILTKLLICRDAYWKIAGEEMGLGKPWEPVYETLEDNTYFTIQTFNGKIDKSATSHRNAIFAFPTKEMRDAFYENFKDLIEQCKELL